MNCRSNMFSPGKIKQRWKPINNLSNFLHKVAVAIGFVRTGVLSLRNIYAVLMHRTPERCKEPLGFGSYFFFLLLFFGLM